MSESFFWWTKEQIEISEKVQEFVENHIEEAEYYYWKQKFPWPLVKKVAKEGYFGAGIPKEYGGAGLHDDTVSFCIITEEIGRIDASWSITTGVHASVCAYPIYAFGTEEQKQEFLIPLAKGDKLGVFALTEANAGSDAGGVETNAFLDGDEWEILSRIPGRRLDKRRLTN